MTSILTGVANYNAFHGCLKCTTVGFHSYESGSTVFPKFDAPKRTDEEFRAQTYGNHHRRYSPVLDLPIDIIDSFPVGDVLHLIDLGNTRKFLLGWMSGKMGNSDARWSYQTQKEITSYLHSCKSPSEIRRRIRGIDEIKRWKGTEFRTFLLYVSIVVLKKHLPQYIYQHFLLYFCGITILLSDYHLKDMIDIADNLLKTFLEHFKKIYGRHYVFSNTHNLCHLVDDVKLFGSLMNFSTYPFENHLYDLKKRLRNGNLPLSQIAKRLIEKQTACFTKNISNNDTKKGNLYKRVPLRSEYLNRFYQNNTYFVYCQLQLPDFLISNSENNSWFLTKRNEIIQVKYIVENLEQIKLLAATARNMKNFFMVPFPSSALHIYISDCKMNTPKMFEIEDIRCKMFKLRSIGGYDDSNSSEDENEESRDISCEFIFIPLNHTLK